MGIPSDLSDVADELQSIERGSTSCVDMLSEQERSVIENVRETYEYLGTGTDRVVFELDESTVVKIARPPQGDYDGKQANEHEYQQFHDAPDDIQRLLAPVEEIAADNQWLVMEKATAIRGYEHEIPEEFLDDWEDAGLDYNDMLTWNVGYIPSKQRDCLIDYGNSIL